MSSRITLLSLGLYKSSGGPAKSVRAFQEALDASVVSWVDASKHQKEPSIWEDEIVVESSRLPILRQLQVPFKRSIRQAEEQIAQSSLVSVHSFWRWHIPWIYDICRRHQVPYWFVPHGSLDPYVVSGRSAIAKSFFVNTFGRTFLNDAQTIIFSTNREREKASAIVQHDRTEVIKWPLDDLDFIARDQGLRLKTREQLGIHPKATCFLYLGRLASMKRPLETIEAFARSSRSDAHLIVAGNEYDVTMAECRKKAIENLVEDRVHVIGPVFGKRKSEVLNSADVYISLSHRENFNFTAAEALAAGLPLILSSGNDLGPELANLEGVNYLSDDGVLCAASAIAQVTRECLTKVAAGEPTRREWALKHLSKDRFTQDVKDAATRHSS